MSFARASALTLAALALGLAAPGVGSAATLDTDPTADGGGRYFFLAANGEANTLTVTGDATHYTFTDSVAITDLDAACTPLSASSLRCARVQGTTPMDRVRVELSAIAVLPPPDLAPNTFRYEGVPPAGTPTNPGLFVGTGFSDTADNIAGSSGDDFIQSFGGDDTIAGADGDDEILDDGGASGTYSGGNGDDKISSFGGGNDSMTGGDGDDTLYATTGVDLLLGEGGNDMLETTQDDGQREGDLLDGGAGDDFLLEQPDNGCESTVADRNIGGPGADKVFDDCGMRDIFKLKDGEADEWHCAGTAGSVDLDPSDVLVNPKLLCMRGPGTTIRHGPRVQTTKHTAKFRFSSPNRQAELQCKLDKGKFKSCKSPKKLKNIGDGKHVFQARAVAGALVGKPDKYRWKVTYNPK